MKTCSKKILVTGGKGFLGSNAAKYFKSLGFEVYGLGHGHLETSELTERGIDHWISADIKIDAIKRFGVNFDTIIHCGGSGSVGLSIENPYEDFKKTVDGTLEILEFARLHSPNAHIIYPSSPAVQGQHPNTPIDEDYSGKPCSPYGFHKKIAEELCESYSIKFGLKISVVRLFSVYGIGLKKQILWDAVNKISKANNCAYFWGTGQETRDFIHVKDVLELFERLILNQSSTYLLINGGSGRKVTILNVLTRIKCLLNTNIELSFNNQENLGNPIYYCASTEKLKKNSLYFEFTDFNTGLNEYVQWAISQQN